MKTNLAKVTTMREDFEMYRIEKFIKIKSINSKRTPDEYLRDLRDFFKSEHVAGKDLKFLTTSDFIINNDMVYDYVLELLEQGLKKVSALRKIASVRSFYNYLETQDYHVNPKWFKIGEIKNDDSRGYDPFTWEEIEQFIEFVKPTRKGKMKALLIETAVRTCFRYEALMGLTVDSFEMQNGVWTLKTNDIRDKGQKVLQASIPTRLYDELIQLAKENKKDKQIKEGRFFALTKKSLRKMIDDFCTAKNIDRTKRRLVFHSFKVSGVTESGIVSNGDLNTIKEQGHHDDVKTTLRFYNKQQRDFSKSASLHMGQKVDPESFKDLTSEQWLEMFMQLDRATQLKMQSILKQG